ncbi:MAG: hypothetical protein LBD02_08370 [Christensenellaceae bacterium]|nr:hypothetical protein [Christensenellaceae bacterium]
MRLQFNEDPEGYEAARPGYPKTLFEDVIRFAALDASKAALEIGIETGRATLPFLQTGCRLTAIEIGIRPRPSTGLRLKSACRRFCAA